MTMQTRKQIGRVLALLLWTGSAVAQSVSVTASHHRQVQIPTRPAALFTGEQGKQRTEIHFYPTTSTVTMKLLVQDLRAILFLSCIATTSQSMRTARVSTMQRSRSNMPRSRWAS